jgi:hypothetical protein
MEHGCPSGNKCLSQGATTLTSLIVPGGTRNICEMHSRPDHELLCSEGFDWRCTTMVRRGAVLSGSVNEFHSSSTVFQRHY